MQDEPARQAELAAKLDEFCGSPTVSQVGQMRLTEGRRYLAGTVGAWWLGEAIVSRSREPEVSREVFQVWTLRRVDEGATLVCTDGNANRICRPTISMTDFSLPSVVIWVEHGTLLLPSEH